MKLPACRTLIVAACVVPAIAGQADAQGIDEVKANYTKYEYRIPMRDGTRLFTAVYVPKDTSKTYPLLMTRTPYSVAPYGVDQYKNDLGPSALFGKEGYIFVYQDVRGRWMSEGEMVNMRPHIPEKKGPNDFDESSDTYDSIDWLLKKVPNHNGKVGMWGISYPGYYTACGLIDSHPALVCASPQAPINDWFMGDDWHHNGALMLPHVFNFMAKFGHARPEPTKKFDHPFDHGTPDGYRFFLEMGPLPNANTKHFQDKIAFWNEVMRHPNYDDFWKARNIRPHLKNVKPAVMTVGGWFDAENLYGALETYKRIESSSPKANNRIVMGPWWHGQWSRDPGLALGNVSFNSKTCDFYREKIELPFFEHHLKGKEASKLPEAWVFETGTNQWRQYDAWPPATAKPATFALAAEGKLTMKDAAASTSTGAQSEFDEYVADPAKPVPFIDWTDIGMAKEYKTADQRFASRRTDVLVYQTEVLESDVTLAGGIDVDLNVSTSGTDADWIVKVIDVYPDDYPDARENPKGVRMGGYQQLVRGDVMRGRFRNGFEKPEPFHPGEPTRVRFTLPDVCHAFRPGHRIMVQVQSSWFPLVDRNPQTFVDIYTAKPEDFKKATQRVYHSVERPSKLTVRIIP